MVRPEILKLVPIVFSQRSPDLVRRNDENRKLQIYAELKIENRIKIKWRLDENFNQNSESVKL
jgi:hypothetical protein